MAEAPAVPDDELGLGSAGVKLPVERPNFIIGCARSGTSILGEAIAAHPRVAYLFEASDLWNAALAEHDDDRLLAEDATDAARSEARRRFEDAVAASPGDVLVEKNPKHVLRIPFLDAVFPDSRFVHILRDGRDVIASLMFRNRGSSWGHLKTPGWRDLLARYPEANHMRCAYQWRDAVTAARRDALELRLGPDRYREVRYEDLVQDPRRVMEDLLPFLGLDAHAAIDAFLPKIQDATERSYHARKQVRHYIENHSRRVGRYRENLTADQLRDVEEVCGPLLHELHYR